MTCSNLPAGALEGLFAGFGIELCRVPAGADVPGSFWGEPEAGIVERRLYVRPDTPIHSALHEGCHLICAGREGRRGLDTDAGGTYAEEDAVCYLQILLADRLPGVGREKIMADMDAWGYTFRLGSAAAWFAGDAEDAHAWLAERGLAGAAG
jgi:hypothetical protein